MERAQETWRAWRAAPWRGELLQAAIVEVGEAAPAGDGWPALVGRLAAMLALDFLTSVQRARVRPELLLLMERLGRIEADAALVMFDLESVGGGAALERLWPRLSAEGLRAALARVRWGQYATCRDRVVAAMLRRALAEGVGEAALREVRGLEEPSRSALVAAILPALAEEDPLRGVLAEELGRSDAFVRVGLLRDLGGTDLRALVEPVAAAEWGRIAAIEDTGRRLDAYELRMAQLGPVATIAESRRWISEVRAAMLAKPDEVYRLQCGVLAELREEAIAGLSPALTCEALVWLGWWDSRPEVERALEAVIGCAELPGRERVRLLGMLLEMCAGLTGEVGDTARIPGDIKWCAAGERAARAMIATPEATTREAMLAGLHLPPDEMAAWAGRWCRRDPLLQGRTELGTWWVPGALARLGEAAGAEGRGELLKIVRGLVAGGDAVERCVSLADFAGWMTEAERAELVRQACVHGDPRTIGTLIIWVPAEEVAATLAGPAAREWGIAEAHERWSTLGGLVGDLPDEQGAAILRSWWAHEQAREGPHGAILAFPRWAMDDALRRELVAHELAHPFRPYTAWLLGTYARGLPEAEVETVIDRAIEEFAAIALAPTSPGNDAGPFVEMADLMTEAQVRRALEIVERMAAIPGNGWGGDLECSRQYLGLRLGALGHGEEAEARIRATHDPAWALGALAAERLRNPRKLSHGTGWEEVAGLFEWEDADALASAVGGLTWALPEAARAGCSEVAEALLGRVHRVEDPERRGDIVEALWEAFGPLLPAERWAEVFAAHTTGARRVALRLVLAATVPGAEGIAGIEEALAEAEGTDLEEWFDAYCAVAPRLPAATRVRWLDVWMRQFSPGPSLVRVLREDAVALEISGVLAALGGDEAVVAYARVMVEVAEAFD